MIVCLIIAILFMIAGIVVAVMFTIEDGLEGFIYGIFSFLGLTFCGSVFLYPFVAIDKASGTTIGTITAVDKNFFGTYTIYLKTAENNEDKYCAETQEIVNIAKENVGKKVQLYYGERVGLYHLNQCRTSPIDKIELKEDK